MNKTKKVLVIFLVLTMAEGSVFAHSLTSLTPYATVDYSKKNTVDFGLGLDVAVNRFNLSLGLLMDKTVGKLSPEIFLGGTVYYWYINDEHLLSLMVMGGLNADINYTNPNSYVLLSPYGRLGFEYITPFNLNLKAFVDLGYNFPLRGTETNGFDVRVGLKVGYSFDIGEKLYTPKDNRHDNLYIGDVKTVKHNNTDTETEEDLPNEEDEKLANLIQKLIDKVEVLEEENNYYKAVEESNSNIRYVAVSTEKEAKDVNNIKSTITDNKDKANVSIDGNHNFDGAITKYVYKRTNIYDVFLTPLNITDIRLEAGENIVSVILGDPNNWDSETIQTSETIDGEDKLITHLLLRPLTTNVQTDCMVATDVRVYYLKLYSTRDTYMTALEFIYPGTRKTSTTTLRSGIVGGNLHSIDEINKAVDDLIFNYKISGETVLRPKRVYSDSERTYLQYSNDFYTSSILPVVYLESENGKRSLVNFIQKGITYSLPLILKNGEKLVLVYDNKEAYVEREY